MIRPGIRAGIRADTRRATAREGFLCLKKEPQRLKERFDRAVDMSGLALIMVLVLAFWIVEGFLRFKTEFNVPGEEASWRGD